MIEFVVPGRPVPAVRMTQRGKWVRPEAQRYLDYKEFIGWLAKRHFSKRFMGPIKLCVEAYIDGGRPGDLDNIVKSIQDGLNGIAWKDDCQVVEIHARRHKGVPERVEIGVEEAEKGAS